MTGTASFAQKQNSTQEVPHMAPFSSPAARRDISAIFTPPKPCHSGALTFSKGRSTLVARVASTADSDGLGPASGEPKTRPNSARRRGKLTSTTSSSLIILFAKFYFAGFSSSLTSNSPGSSTGSPQQPANTNSKPELSRVNPREAGRCQLSSTLVIRRAMGFQL